MITMDRRQEEVLYTALDMWGTNEQLFMLTEEVGELLSSINKWRRDRIDPEGIVDEIADVHIMLAQLCILIGGSPSLPNDIIEQKIERLKQRIL